MSQCRRFIPLLMSMLLWIGHPLEGSEPAATTLEFPAYKIHPGHVERSNPYFPTTNARLCLVTGQRECFTLASSVYAKHPDGDTFYGLLPKAMRVTLPSGGSLILFHANSGGGSGSSDRFVLLRYESDGHLNNLLPSLILSNQSDIALWDIPSVSSMPILATADFIWEGMEAHYGRHFYQIRAYRYDPRTERYRQVFKYLSLIHISEPTRL